MRTVILAGLLTLLMTVGSAQAATRLAHTPGFNGSVHAISEPDTAGVRYVGGEFTMADPWDTGGGAALGTASGAVRPAFPKIGSPTDDEVVNAVASDGSGGFYVGGLFSCVGGDGGADGNCTGAGEVAVDNLVHLRADGSIDESWMPRTNDAVTALAVLGSTVYIGGDFTTVAGKTRSHLAAIDASGAATAWNPGASAGAQIKALAIRDTTIYIGGSFSTIAGQSRDNIAAVDTANDLAAWAPNANGTVYALAIAGTTVYVGGSFSTIGAAARDNVGAIDAAGTATSWNPGADAAVRALAVSGSTIYAGGSFTTLGGAARTRLGAVATDGSVTAWNPDAYDVTIPSGGVDQSQISTLVTVGPLVYAGGRFNRIGESARIGVAAIDAAGAATSWDAGVSASSTTNVRAIALDGTTAYVGGTFATAGGTPRAHLAAITADGTLTSWNPGANDAVEAIVPSGNRVYIGGEFTTVGGQPRTHLAAVGLGGDVLPWRVDATGVPQLQLGNWVRPGVHALALSASSLFIGGAFTTVAGEARRGSAAINISGACLDTSAVSCLRTWNPSNFGEVQGLEPYGDAMIITGAFLDRDGNFATFGLTAVQTSDACMNAYDTTAGCVLVLQGGFGTEGAVAFYDMRASRIVNDALIVGGYFTTLPAGYVGDPKTLAAIAPISTCINQPPDWPCVHEAGRTSANWAPIMPQINAIVRGMTSIGTTLYAGGAFNCIGDYAQCMSGNSLGGLAAISVSTTCLNAYTDAGCVQPWAPVLGYTGGGGAWVLRAASDAIWTGGTFFSVDQTPRSNFAIIGTDGRLGVAAPITPPTLSAVSPASGPKEGGTAVTLAGHGLGLASAVTIGGHAATFAVFDDDTITATTPAGAVGAADVVVTTPSGKVTITGGFTYTGSFTHTGKAPSKLNLLRAPTATRTTISYTVFAPGPGTIQTVVRLVGRARAGRVVCQSHLKVKKQGTVRVSCKLTKTARRLRSTTGLRLALRSTFTPKSGAKQVVTKRFAIGPSKYAPSRVTG